MQRFVINILREKPSITIHSVYLVIPLIHLITHKKINYSAKAIVHI